MTVGVLCFFLTVPGVGLWYVVVAFRGHTHKLIQSYCSLNFLAKPLRSKVAHYGNVLKLEIEGSLVQASLVALRLCS